MVCLEWFNLGGPVHKPYWRLHSTDRDSDCDSNSEPDSERRHRLWSV
jgi:hypothetical protein